MGLFGSGIGGAYAAMGLANAINNFPQQLNAIQDRKRKLALQDEELQAWRDDRANRMKQQDFENTLRTNADSRAATTAGLEQQQLQHTIGRYGTTDKQNDDLMAQRLAAEQYANSPELRSLQQAYQRAQIGHMGAMSASANAETVLRGMQLQNMQIEQRRQQAVRDADAVDQQVRATNDPTLWRDWLNAHGTPGHDVQIAPSKKGGWDVQNYYNGKALNTQHLDSLDQFSDAANRMVDPDMYRKMQMLGIHRGHYVAARGDGDIPLNFDQRTGRYYTQDGNLYTGKLSPSQYSMFGSMGIGGGQPQGQQPSPANRWLNPQQDPASQQMQAPQGVDPRLMQFMSQPTQGE